MKKLVIVVALALLLTSCSSPRSPNPTSMPTPIPTQPIAPSNLGAEAISHNLVSLWWTDNSHNEEGFNVYRNGVLIDSLGPNVSTFQDKNLNYATGYSYSVSAYNDFGESSRTTPISLKTLNPPVTITLDRVGVYESGEHWLRGAPEQYLQLVATDGITTQEHRIPYQEYLSLNQDEAINIGTKIFSTQEIGDYLRLFIIAYEKDGSQFELLVSQAVGSAALDVVTGGATMGIGMLFGDILGGLIGSLIGSEDDHLGTYEQVWYADDLWGAGKYQDVARENLRVWFTISVAGAKPIS